MPLPELSRGRHAVLALYRDQAVWIESTPEGASVGSALIPPSASGEPAAAARAALAARTAAGGRASRIVLALGESWLALGFVAVPPLSPSERRAVLARKATAAVAGRSPRSPGDVLFAAAHAASGPARTPDAGPPPAAPRSPGPAASGTPAEPERWLTAAIARARLDDLTRALVQAGLVPRRVVAARLAALSSRVETGDGVHLVALRDPDGAALALCSRGAILQLGALADAGPSALATALLQEARSHAACARRTLRGELVARIELVGFEQDESEALAPRLAAGLGAPCAAPAGGARSLHDELLSGALGRGRWNLDLLPPRIRRPRRAALLSAGALLLTLSIAAVTSVELARQRRELAGELRELQREAGRAEHRDDAAAELPAELAALEEAVAHLESVRASARAFGDDLAAFATAVDGAVGIETLELGAHHLRATGSADARPLVALAALERVRRKLLAQGAAAVRLAPATSSARTRPSAPAAEAVAPGTRFVLDVERAP